MTLGGPALLPGILLAPKGSALRCRPRRTGLTKTLLPEGTLEEKDKNDQEEDKHSERHHVDLYVHLVV